MIASNVVSIKFKEIISPGSGELLFYIANCRAPDGMVLANITSTDQFRNTGTTFAVDSIDDYRALLQAIQEAIREPGYMLLKPAPILIQEAQNMLDPIGKIV